jgi:hypothetical protein
MEDEVMYMLTIHKDGSRVGLEVGYDKEQLEERAKAYDEYETKIWFCVPVEDGD